MSLSSIGSSLAPHGVLRVGINLSNFLLVSKGPHLTPDAPSYAPSYEGVVPDLAHRLAQHLSLPLELVPYKNPALLTADADADRYDVACLGAEPQRAEVICFTQPYCEIQATFLVPPGSPLKEVEDVDAPGVDVCVSRGAAYCLWLESNLGKATLHRTDEPGLSGSLNKYLAKEHGALAGLRPWLLDQAVNLPGHTVLPGSFMSVQQSFGVPRSRADGGATMFLERWIGELKEGGVVQDSIELHGMTGKLSVAK